MSTYPVVYEQSPPIERSRLTVFFRWILVIPQLIWSVFYGIGAVAPPPESLSRLTTFFRGLIMIPVYIIMYVFLIWIEVVGIALWFVGVFTGKTSAGLTEAVRFPMAYITRATAYSLLLTDGWPPFED